MNNLYAVIDPSHPRAKFWLYVWLGYATPIISGETSHVEMEDGFEGEAYMTDFSRVDDATFNRLVDLLSRGVGSAQSVVAAELREIGMPVPAGPEILVTADVAGALIKFTLGRGVAL